MNWFSFYGIPKKYWKQHYVNFDKIKEFGPPAKKPQSGLGQWGI